jgi:RND family efflux transporter MFP subunit
MSVSQHLATETHVRPMSGPVVSTLISLPLGLAAFALGLSSLAFFLVTEPQDHQAQVVPQEERPAVLRLPVITQALSGGTVRQAFEAQGRIEPVRKALVSIPDSGIIGTLLVSEGTKVSAGTPLAEMVAPPGERIQMARAEEDYARAQREIARYQRLQATAPNAVSALQAQQVQDDLADARLALEALQQARSRRQILAPIDGVIARLDGVSGQMVNGGFAVAELHDVSSYTLPLDLPEIALNGLRSAEGVGIRSINQEDRAVGTIDHLPQTIDPESGTGRVLIHIPEPPDGWRSGGFVLVDFVTEEVHGEVVIPAGAVRYQRNRPYTWVARPDDEAGLLAHRVWLTLGLSDGDRIIVDAGLAVGDEVIITGASGLSHLAPIEIESDRVQP